MRTTLLRVCGFASVLLGCQHLNFSRGETAPEKPPTCLGDAKELEHKKFAVDGALESRLKAVFGGVLELENTAKKLDEKLAGLCDNLSRELGAPKPATEAEGAGEPESETVAKEAVSQLASEAACQRAIEQVKAYKEKHSVALSIEAEPFFCAPRSDDFAACARRCDTNLPPGNLELTCEDGAQRGRCSGKCTGQCAQLNTSECTATCEGECKGGCDKGFYGKCGGKCVGTCDMANVNGKCSGMCDGKCSSDADGKCEGKCSGKCVGTCLADTKGKSCDGTCRGQCDAVMSGGICSQIFPPAEMSQECVALCTAVMTSKLQCSADHVSVTLVRAEKESEGLKLRGALSSRVKDILEIGDGMKASVDDAGSRVTEVLDALGTDLEANAEGSKAVGTCLSEAKERQVGSASAFAKFAEISASLLQAARN